MVALDAIVLMLVGVVKGVQDELLNRRLERLSEIGDDFVQFAVRGLSIGEESKSCADVTLDRDVDVDHLAMLINSAVDIAPDAGGLDVSLVHEPSIADAVTTWPRRVDQQRREALDLSVDRDVINLDSAFGQEFFHVSI